MSQLTPAVPQISMRGYESMQRMQLELKSQMTAVLGSNLFRNKIFSGLISACALSIVNVIKWTQ